jgi:pimeloyl-ACP methyl ester carboxylesterase
VKKFTQSRWLGVIVACFFGFTLAGYAASPGVGWSPCYSSSGPFECGIVQVPLDYHEPNGASIAIALIRLPALDSQRRIGSLFFNPGGPGGSGVEFLLVRGLTSFAALRERFDLVGFDPRGIARSTALRCFGSSQQWDPYFTPFAYPSTPEEESEWITSDRYFTAACAQRGSRIIDHMSTANVARDLDLMRQAVGDQKLNFVGYSYGSYLGLTYANLFPDNFRALVVDAVVDPIAWATGYGNEGSTLPFSTRLRSDIGSQSTLNEFFRLCDAGGVRCALAPNSASRFASIGERLKIQPIQFTFPDGSVGELNYSTFIAITLTPLYRSSLWESFAQLLADLDGQVNLSQLGARLEPLWEMPGYINKRGFPRYRNSLEGSLAVSCSDTDNPHTYAAWSAAGHAADAANGYFGSLWTWTPSSGCAEWPGADHDRYIGPFNTYTTNPVLVVGNLFDPATRYEGAVTAANLLPNSRLLTVHAWGHSSLGKSSCASNVVSRYLNDLVLPAPGTVCQQDRVPFAAH